jgi:hypothetical protein
MICFQSLVLSFKSANSIKLRYTADLSEEMVSVCAYRTYIKYPQFLGIQQKVFKGTRGGSRCDGRPQLT